MSASQSSDTRTPLIGAAAIVGVVAFWALLIPFVNSLVEGSNPFEPGEPYDFGGGATVVPAAGWSPDEEQSSEGFLTTLRKGAATFQLIAPDEADGTLDESLELGALPLRNDPNRHWEIGEPVLFETDAGAPAGAFEAHSSNEVQSGWYVNDGAREAAAAGIAGEDSWPQVRGEMEAMTRSIDLDGASGAASDADEEGAP
jgi:hypothetical protein